MSPADSAGCGSTSCQPSSSPAPRRLRGPWAWGPNTSATIRATPIADVADGPIALPPCHAPVEDEAA
jgi:hypothetical protein